MNGATVYRKGPHGMNPTHGPAATEPHLPEHRLSDDGGTVTILRWDDPASTAPTFVAAGSAAVVACAQAGRGITVTAQLGYGITMDAFAAGALA